MDDSTCKPGQPAILRWPSDTWGPGLILNSKGDDVNRKRALITGVTGQDGSYMAEQLLQRGYEVHGLVRRSSTFNRSRIDHLHREEHESAVGLQLHYGDVTDSLRVHQVVSDVRPAEV